MAQNSTRSLLDSFLRMSLWILLPATLAAGCVVIRKGAQPDARLAKLAAGEKGTGIQVWAADPLIKIFRDAKPGETLEEAVAEVARGEHATLQVIARSDAAIEGVTASLGPFRLERGWTKLAADQAQVRFVQDVQVAKPTPQVSSLQLREPPAAYPDYLDTGAPVAVKPGEAQAVWVTLPIALEATVFVKRTPAPVGTARGWRDFSVTSPWGARCTPRRSAYRACGHQLVPDEQPRSQGLDRAVLGPLLDAAARLRPQHGGASAEHGAPLPARNGPVLGSGGRLARDQFRPLRPRGPDHDRRRGDGRRGGPHRVARGGLGGAVQRPDRPGARRPGGPREGRAVERRGGRLLCAFFPALVAHLREKGWLGQYMQHLADEPVKGNIASYRALSALAQKHAPELRVIEACHTKDLAGAIQIWVPQLNYFHDDYAHYQERQRQGDEVWFYTCMYPQGEYANRFIEQPLVLTRLLHWLNFRYGATGYLHWGYNFWQGDPFVDTIQNNASTYLPAGDCAIIYPGPEGQPLDSLRIKAMRDGIADYELLSQLADRDAQAAQRLAQRLILDFNRYETSAPAFRQARRELLEAVGK